jgi:ribosomal protein S18 acetylase RimI-like enzyme
VHDLILGALAGNDAAIRLYERLGFRPTWLYLSRWSGRGDTAVRPNGG